jgi:catalase
MALNTLDFFPVATPEAFAELMYAKSQGSDAVKIFKEKNDFNTL